MFFPCSFHESHFSSLSFQLTLVSLSPYLTLFISFLCQNDGELLDVNDEVWVVDFHGHLEGGFGMHVEMGSGLAQDILGLKAITFK